MGFVKIEKTKDCPGPEQKVATVATDHYCPAVGRFPGCPRRKHLARLPVKRGPSSTLVG
jgi:hypothetical protein